ncbi:hypothetical protein [Streptomyces sp. SID13031]|uniref:hypothetical protein n=1 Tax=Streptomyces sp. SID13031 TaxID=2706046 RepID=UPI0013CAFBE3|nr:hypothetical protein [Streptomyces sp. SID13031]NEA33190.1 hypothetical protein [Streptomyces sp. SID13031]
MADLGVGAVSSYLADAGWSRSDQTWNGAAIWSNGLEEVLVPPRDGLGDSAARLKDLLRALESFEKRPVGEIARDIAYPLLDTASYRAPTASQPAGFVPLESGLGALQGLHDLFRMAAQTVLRSPYFGSGTLVSELLSGVHLGTTTSQQFSVTLLVPLGEETIQPPPGRRVLVELSEAALAVRRAVADGEARPTGIDSLPESVSPDFCTALTALGAGDESFELGFRWARGIPSQLPDRVVDFPTGSGRQIRELSDRLRNAQRARFPAASRELPVRSGPVTITGQVEALHDNETGSDRWRVKIRGAVLAEGSASMRRVLWVRLPGQDAYDVALSAHRNHQQVQIAGLWTETAPNRVRIIAGLDGLRVVDNP